MVLGLLLRLFRHKELHLWHLQFLHELVVGVNLEGGDDLRVDPREVQVGEVLIYRFVDEHSLQLLDGLLVYPVGPHLFV